MFNETCCSKTIKKWRQTSKEWIKTKKKYEDKCEIIESTDGISGSAY